MGDTVIVVMNPSNAPVRETLALRNGMLMDDSALIDALSATSPIKIGAGFITVELPPWGWRVLKPEQPDAQSGYSVYKRVP